MHQEEEENGVSHYPPLPAIELVEWTYEMRREMQEIVPGLFLGPYSAAAKNKCEELKARKVTHIVCIREGLEAHFIKPNFPHVFRYLELDIADKIGESIIQHIHTVRNFLEECFAAGGKVLVHGNAGISRSATLVIAFIMEKYGMRYRDAIALVQQRRFCVSPNERFAQQLREYEPIYRAKSNIRGGNIFQTQNFLKRKYEDSDDGFEVRSHETNNF